MKSLLIIPLLLIYLFYPARTFGEIAVQKVRYSSYKDHTRVVVDVNGPIRFTSNRLPNPDRLYFDLKDCILPKRIKHRLPINDGIIKVVRISQFNKRTARVVLDLQKIERFYAFTLEDPHRLVIDVYAERGHLPTKQKNDAMRIFSGIKKVVIDPGHGGKDPGAIGPRGLKEKDVVLAIGKRLGRILRERYGVEVVYTRDRDVFVPLNERTEIANSSNADLFISIHTNASRKRRSRGIETYFLNWTNNKEAMRVAARENAISFKKMQKAQDNLQMMLYKKMQKTQDNLQMMLYDLRRDNKRDESIALASSIQESVVNTLKRDYRNIKDLGVKWALFYVLVGAEMPSVLVEVSFITNHEEEKRLARRSYRDKIAEGIAKGIDAYLKQSTLVVKRVSGSI